MSRTPDATHDGPLDWAPPDSLDTSVRLTTERLELRLYRLDESDRLLESLDSSRVETEPWESWTRALRTLDEAYAYVVRQRLNVRDLGTSRGVELGAFDLASGHHVGGVGLHSINTDTASGEVGYWLRTDRTGQGLATEAVGRVVSWMLGAQEGGGLGLARVVARCSGENEASSRVCQRLGLPLELRQPRAYYVKGLDKITELLGYGVLANEWDHDQHRAKPGTPTTRLTPAPA